MNSIVRHNTGILTVGFILCAFAATAQKRKPAPAAPQNPVRAVRSDTTIKGTTLEVYQVYQPELKPLVKPELSPALPPVAKEPTPQQYEVPQQTLNYSYRALPLRPLALGGDTAATPPQNYALLAGGNLSTILAEAGIGSLRGRDWNATLFGRYIAQEGALENQVYRSFNLRGAGSYRSEGHVFEAGLSAYRNVVGAYGYDHDALRYNFDQVRKVYSAEMITLGVYNTQPAFWGLQYHPQLNFGFFKMDSVSEPGLNISLPATKAIDSSLSISFAINGQFAWSKFNAYTLSNSVLQFVPALDYRRDGFTGHIALAPTVSEGAGLLLLPDMHIGYQTKEHKLACLAAWQAHRIQNTVQQLTRENPFIAFIIPDRQQTTRQEVYGSVALALGAHLSVWGRGGWQKNDGLPLFITQPGGDGKAFTVVYDMNNQAIVWAGGLRYAVGEDFSIGAEGSWYNFYKHSYNQVYGEPSVRLKGDASWRIIDGLQLTTYVEVLDKIWGRNATGMDVEQRGVFDFGAAGEYTFASRFSVLVRAENLLSRKNERWLGYPSFGFNIYGGLRFRF